MAPSSSQDEVVQITELRDAYVDAENSGDVDGILATCGDDIVFIPPEAPPVKGMVAAREFLTEFLEAFDITIELSRDQIAVEGDLAYQWGGPFQAR